MDFTEILEEAVARTGVPEIANRFDTVLKFAERHLNRELQGASRSVASVAITTDANGDYTLPSDFNSIKSVYKGTQKLHNSTEDYIRGLQGKNGFYIDNTTLKTEFANTDLSVTYYANLPPLKDNTTNWLSTYDPEIYLYAVMWQGLSFAGMQTNDAKQLQLLVTKGGSAKAYLDELIRKFKENDRINKYAGIRVNVGAVQ